MLNLFPVEGHTVNVKWYLPITKGCLEYFSRYLRQESFSVCIMPVVYVCLCKYFHVFYNLLTDRLTCLRYRIAILPNEHLATESSEVISKILSTANAHCASSL